MRKFVAAGIVSALAVLVFGAGPATGQTTATGKAAAIVEPSVVYLEQEWVFTLWIPKIGYLWEDPLSYTTRCTGFVINPEGYIATAGHCVDPAREPGGVAYDLITQYGVPRVQELLGWDYDLVVETFDPLGEGAWKVYGGTRGAPLTPNVTVQHGVAAGGVDTGEALAARVIDHTGIFQGDVALLKVESPNAMPALQLAEKDTIEIGTRVVSVGYPGAADDVTDASYEPTFQDGSINSQKTREGGQLPVYEISSEMSGGMSGGPTVDTQGRVVGINSFEHAEETSFDFITPISLLNEMLAQNGIDAKQGPNDIAYRAGLQAYFAKDYNRAAFEFQKVTQLAPEHKLAQEYLQKARQKGGDPALYDPTGGGGLPIAMILGGVAGLLLIGGGVAFMLLRRRRGAAPAGAPAAAPLPPAMAEPTVAPTTQDLGNGETTAPVAPKPRRKSPASAPKKTTASRPKATTSAARKPAAAKATATRKTGKFCPDCGTKNVAAAKFCENCGHSF